MSRSKKSTLARRRPGDDNEFFVPYRNASRVMNRKVRRMIAAQQRRKKKAESVEQTDPAYISRTAGVSSACPHPVNYREEEPIGGDCGPANRKQESVTNPEHPLGDNSCE